jgi:hypothetical protein
VGFLLAEFDRGHIVALLRIINWMQVGAPNGATFRHSIVFGSPRPDFPQDGGSATRSPRRHEALSTSARGLWSFRVKAKWRTKYCDFGGSDGVRAHPSLEQHPIVPRITGKSPSDLFYVDERGR